MKGTKTVSKPKSKEELAKEAEAAKALAVKIADLKVKYGRPDNVTGKKIPLAEVFVLTVGDKTAFLRKPERGLIADARVQFDGDAIRFNEFILENVWLEGDEEIKTDDDYFINAMPFLNGLIEAKVVELKKS